ncbi:hypothetical protein [Isoptericola sp. BMS4]|uniref:hypothetical protein n=1 Tax=Isoptericola sp. BMS4 TaxID=2527875 RepID=UPI001420C109|nr:hypothetical protein [Isoptericola sp. BMS4]
MSNSMDLLLVQAIHRERLEQAEHRRTLRRLRRQHTLPGQPLARRQRTSIARWLHDRLAA